MPRSTGFRRNSSFSDRPRRKTFWVASADSTAVQALAAGAAILDQSLTWTDELGPSTIVRTRGSLWVGSDQAAASERPFGAMGFALVSEQARGIGITAVPQPISDESSDLFFVWQPFLAATLIATAVGFAGVAMERYDFDSKAMRKINEGDAVAVTLENASAADGLNYVIKWRMLIKTG